VASGIVGVLTTIRSTPPVADRLIYYQEIPSCDAPDSSRVLDEETMQSGVLQKPLSFGESTATNKTTAYPEDCGHVQLQVSFSDGSDPPYRLGCTGPALPELPPRKSDAFWF
jgi:hypothetical protein